MLVEFGLDFFGIGLSSRRSVLKESLHAVKELLLPLTNLDRVALELLGQLGDGRLAGQAVPGRVQLVAFKRLWDLHNAVFGPELRLALALFAAICRSVAMIVCSARVCPPWKACSRRLIKDRVLAPRLTGFLENGRESCRVWSSAARATILDPDRKMALAALDHTRHS